MQKRWLGILALIAIVSVFIWALMPRPIPVEVATVERGTYRQMVEEDGKTRAKEVYVVSSPVRANLLRIPFDAGDYVEKGQVVAKIVPATTELLDVRKELQLEEALGAAQAALLRAKVLMERAYASYETAKSDLARKQKLAKPGFVSKSELEHEELTTELKKKEYESAQHNVESKEHELKRAEIAIKHYQDAYQPQIETGHVLDIKAPVSGQIIKINRESEGAISVGSPIIEIADVKDLEIVVDILSTDAVKIPKNADVIIKRWGKDEPLKGKVRVIEPGGFTKISALGVEEQRVNVIVDIVSPREEWRNLGADFQLDAEIIIFKRDNELKVPVSALFRSGKSWAVFLYDDGVARLHPIKIKWRNPEFAAVESGLKAGDQVIVYPGDRIKDGVRVQKLDVKS